jgi:N6-adenosine-specific RNA methylase IME4
MTERIRFFEERFEEFHPLANILPMMEGAQFAALVDDIRANGLREPVVHYQGKILDGRTRYRACETASVVCRFKRYEGNDPAAYVLSLNLRRRHLDPSQRAMVAARMWNLGWGQRADRVEGSIDLSTAAALVNVSQPSVKRARLVLERGTAELQQAVDRGRLAVHEAAKAAKYAPEAQQEFLTSNQQFSVWSTNRRRKDKPDALPATTRALPVGEKRWPVMLVDAAWRLKEMFSTSSRSVENHYPTQPLDEIMAMRVPDIAVDDCILFLWATAPMLPEALEVIKAWGFKYLTNLVWDKEIIGLGQWVRNQHEHLLVAVRGNFPKPEFATMPASIIRERRREHSRKPEAAYVLIEAMYPGLDKIELFARHARPGWARWGNEAPPQMQAANEDDENRARRYRATQRGARMSE